MPLATDSLMDASLPLPQDFAFDAEAILAAKHRLMDAGVESCFAVFVDIYGVPKAKATPIQVFEKMCQGAELYTVGACEGMGLAGPHEDECATVPDLDSLVICPWNKTQAWVSSDLYHHGKPYWGSPRGILKSVMDRAASMGFSMNLGIEPEFYIFQKDETTGALKPITGTHFQGPNACYDVNLTGESMPFLKPITDYLHDLGWGLYSFDQECGRGQHELDFGFTDALTMSDRFIFLRHMVKQVAASIGAVATFMPKPFADDFRSGAHFNMSLADIDSGVNVFEASDANPLGVMASKYGIAAPDIAYHFAAGILKHAEAITAVTCSTYNSYQGLIAQGDLADFSWAPVLQTYGKNNRSSMLRLPMNRPCVENRAVDMAVNPYLAAAITLAAGLEGIEQQLDPGKPFNDDLYKRSRKELTEAGVHTLPPTLLHALEAFEKDPISEVAFGASFKEVYLSHKRSEWERSFFKVSQEQRDDWLTYI